MLFCVNTWGCYSLKIINVKNDYVIADMAKEAKSFWKQLKGLIGKKSFDSGSAMIFPKCKQIHTYFMRFPIDIIFIDEQNIVIAATENLGKNRISKHINASKCVIELPAGTINQSDLKIGDKILIENG